MLAFLLALYAIFPPAYVLGPPRLGLPLLSTSAGDGVVQNELWVRIFAERELVFGPFHVAVVSHLGLWNSARNPPERALLYPTYGALLGAWIGVIPIGLDWDRPWQVITSYGLCMPTGKLTQLL